MNQQPNASPLERYVGLDVHKHYVMAGGVDRQKQWVLRPRKVRVSKFLTWAERNLKSTDAVVIESTSNAWTIYDIVAPLVSATVVADPRQVSEIAKTKVKTDKRDIERLLRSLISYRWRLNKQITI